MSDSLLERIAVALEKIAAASGGVAPVAAAAVAASQPAVAAAAGTKITSDDLLAIVQPLVQAEDTKAKVKAVLEQHGLNRLGEATEAQYPTLYAAFQTIAGAAPAPATAASQDLI